MNAQQTETTTTTTKIAMPTHSNELRELNAIFGRINDKAWINQFLQAAERTISMADKGVISFSSFRMHSQWIEGVEVAELRRMFETYLDFLEKTGCRVTKLQSLENDLWLVLM